MGTDLAEQVHFILELVHLLLVLQTHLFESRLICWVAIVYHISIEHGAESARLQVADVDRELVHAR